MNEKMENKKLRLDVTSSAFCRENGQENLEACLEACHLYDFDFGIQIHNSTAAEDLQKMVEYGVKLSAHAPLLSEYNINLAAESFELTKSILEQNIRLFHELGITEGVFHGFGMTDKPIPTFNRNRSYDDCMTDVFRTELSFDGKSRLCCDFTGTEEFKMRLLRVKSRLRYIREQYPDILLCIENDFPAYGSANMFPENAAKLEHPICLDTGHLWASSYLFDRDFHTDVMKFLELCEVRMVHLHASKYTSKIPKLEWSDGHLPLTIENQMDLPRFVSSCRKAKVNYFVLEVVKATAADIHAFAQMWNK
ncbi:MAG: hypothetical protein WC071_09725 [Victivallaceae bacterium]